LSEKTINKSKATNEEVLQALKNRCKFLKNKFPDIKKCKMCDNPVDITMLGFDTCCPYHRMLFDSYFYNAMDEFGGDIEKVREEFDKWNKTLSGEQRNNIVAEMGKSSLNWMC